jgi:DNA-binding response OmpR family regulator
VVADIGHAAWSDRVGPPIAPTLTVATRLLVVEDNASTSFAIRAFFQSAGYDVDAVADRASAIGLLDDKQYEVVITDLNLGSTQSHDGMDVVSDTRRRLAQACIIMLTAFGSAAAEGEARRRGADLFCAKPVALRDLSSFIDKVLRRDHWTSATIAEGR